MNVFTTNKVVACTPPTNKTVTTRKESGFATIEQKSSLEELEVVFGATDFERGPYCRAGMKVFVKGEEVTSASWAKKEYELDGKKFVLVPVTSIVVVYDKDWK